MRSRSSRLFVVLLHLVGVSTNFPRNPFLAALHPDKLRSGVGIVGVHPLSILLEPLELQAAGGLGELLSLLEGAGYDVEKTVLGEPYWLQDDTDGKCLGPDGFSECGDATLWKIKRRPVVVSGKKSFGIKNKDDLLHHKKGKTTTSIEYNHQSATSRFLAIFGWDESTSSTAEATATTTATTTTTTTSETTWEYALALVDVNSSPPFGAGDKDENDLNSSFDGECVVRFAVEEDDHRSGNLELGSCSSDNAWSWSINEGGVLRWDEKTRMQNKHNGFHNKLGNLVSGGALTRIIEMSSGNNNEQQQQQQQQSKSTTNQLLNENKPSQCLWRFNETSVRTEPCNALASAVGHPQQTMTNKRIVGLSLIQYQNSAAVSPKLPRFSDGPNPIVQDAASTKQQRTDKQTETEIETESHLPHTKSYSTSRSTSDLQNHKMVPMGVGGYHERSQLKSNSGGGKVTKKIPIQTLTPVGVGGYFEAKNYEAKSKGNQANILHHPPSSSPYSQYDDAPHKTRKIPVHPYIAASKDGVYADPNTDLGFPTDIHVYLGHDRKESGRHTLMGVGLFTKTMLKIKVYSVGLYVPKRDVLADSNFAPYAGMSVEELRNCDSFYDVLLNEGTVDKTLFIKLNMQLATETVRQSLSAEWQLLSDEHKAELASSSAEPREAEERMLQTIQNKENTGNCSCGQTAPPEYGADHSCCARGTEMVFTWRKNGNLELRIDGRLTSTFTDPVIGKGIFFEYLRGDDPMSVDARDHFVDGFPFLLAPLAQVKGVSSSVPNQQDPPFQTKKGKERRMSFVKAARLIGNTANSVSVFVQGNVNGGITNVGNVLNVVSKSTQNLGADVERTWEQFMIQLAPGQMKNNISIWRKKHIKLKDETGVEEKENDKDTRTKSSKRKRDIRHHLAKMLDEISSKRPLSDEIGVIIEPTMSSTHMLFLYMVHFYLVLLLIVSVPDLHRNRLVKMRRSSVSTMDSESDHEERLTELECWGQLSDDKTDQLTEFVVETSGSGHNSNLKKSLSYYL